MLGRSSGPRKFSLFGHHQRNVETHVYNEFTSPFGRLGGAHSAGNLKEVRNRMKSVKSIEKITKTMKMIANSRLKAAQLRMEKSRPFARGSTSMLNFLPKVDTSKRNVIIPVNTDRGLCGAINSSISKLTRNVINERSHQHPEATFRLIPLGEKASSLYARDQAQRLAFIVGDLGKRPFNFSSASYIAEKILTEEPFDSITLIYNRFTSAISYTQEVKDLPSFTQFMDYQERADYDPEDGDDDQAYLDLTEFHVASTIFSAGVEGACAELSARMGAMDSASKNAGEMLKLLNVYYNRRRQAAITTELTEIISGASAIEGT